MIRKCLQRDKNVEKTVQTQEKSEAINDLKLISLKKKKNNIQRPKRKLSYESGRSKVRKIIEALYKRNPLKHTIDDWKQTVKTT